MIMEVNVKKTDNIIGRTLSDRYKVIKPLGQGTYGSVYMVYDIKLGKNWALKLTSVRTHGELEALKRIDHPAFPCISDLIGYEDMTGIIMDYIDGVSLKDYSKTHTISISTLYEWMCEITSAFKYIHSMTPAILYMDCKPSNIILGKDGHLHLIDLGSAYICGVTEASMISGTLPYAAPEQRTGSYVDARSDIYALGVTIQRLAGLNALRPGLTGHIKVRMTKKRELYVLSDIILRCTADSPSKRYQSADELKYQLEHPETIRQVLPPARFILSRITDIIYKQVVTAFSILSFYTYAECNRLPYLFLGIILFILLLALSHRYEHSLRTDTHHWQCNRDILLCEVSGTLILILLCIMLQVSPTYADGVSHEDNTSNEDYRIPSVTIYDDTGAMVLYKGQYVVREGDNLYLYIPVESLSPEHIPTHIEVTGADILH